MQPRVFIPQIIETFDEESQRMTPKYDFSLAEKFGDIHPILDRDDRIWFTAKITNKIRAALADFSDDDYLVAVGDPSIIAMCAGVILRRSKGMKMLCWDRRSAEYVALDINL